MNNMMYFTESVMLSLMILICVQATITDLRRGIIQNKILLFGTIISVIFNSVYYIIFASEYVQAFIINFGVMVVLSVFFYSTHIWAAGDSKLLMFVVSLIPARIYYSGNNVAASVSILIVIFSLAFFFYVFESFCIGIKEKSLFSMNRLKIDVLRMVTQYVKCTCVITLINFLVSIVMPIFYNENVPLFMIINMIIVLLICNVELLNKWYAILPLVVLTSIIITIQGREFRFANWAIYGVVCIVVILRILAEKYNYKIIPTEEVKCGMVLSYGTIMLFQPSKVKGLPTYTTEDIRSRISEGEAESIVRWKDSKYGRPVITIVRKIPFAIFITMGTIFYLLMRMLLWKLNF